MKEQLGAVSRCPSPSLSSTPELEQAFVSQTPERSENRVGVHSEDCRQVSSRGQSFTRLCFSVSDGAPDLRCDLLVEGESLALGPQFDARLSDSGYRSRSSHLSPDDGK